MRSRSATGSPRARRGSSGRSPPGSIALSTELRRGGAAQGREAQARSEVLGAAKQRPGGQPVRYGQRTADRSLDVGQVGGLGLEPGLRLRGGEGEGARRLVELDAGPPDAAESADQEAHLSQLGSRPAPRDRSPRPRQPRMGRARRRVGAGAGHRAPPHEGCRDLRGPPHHRRGRGRRPRGGDRDRGRVAFAARGGADDHQRAGLRDSVALRQLALREEEGDLGARVLVRVGAVDRVPPLRLRIERAHRAGRGLGGIGGPDRLAEARHRALRLQDHGHHRARAHELYELVVEGAPAVDRVERPGLGRAQPRHPHGPDGEAGGLQVGDDRAGVTRAHGVGLDYGERPVHASIPSLTRRTRSTGRSATATPFSLKALTFSSAVPEDPEMIAPACPILLPGGAVRPAMKPTTGFSMLSLTKRAASCSSVPPISPIITTARVSGSASKAARQSMKSVPMSGSPPIPTQADLADPGPA